MLRCEEQRELASCNQARRVDVEGGVPREGARARDSQRHSEAVRGSQRQSGSQGKEGKQGHARTHARTPFALRGRNGCGRPSTERKKHVSYCNLSVLVGIACAGQPRRL